MNAFTPPAFGQPEQLEAAPPSRRPPIKLLAALAVVVAFVAGGVAGALVFGGAEAEPQPGPQAVTETYFDALVDKQCDQAMEQVHMEGFTCDKAFAFGVESFKVGEAVVDEGDHARVPVELTGNGLANDTEFILDEFDGRWKITGPVSTPPKS